MPTFICQSINSFLTDRQQLVRLGKFSSTTRTISTGAPQCCVLSPLVFSLYMNDCTSKDPSVKLLKFADDTTLIGLIQDGDESAYRQEVKELSGAVLTTWSWTRSKHWRWCGLQEKTPCSRLLSKSLVQPSPLFRNCTHPEWAKELAKSLWTPHIHTPSLNCYRLVDATKLWAPEQPDTRTVSSLKQSISWTLDNNYGTHTICTIIHLYLTQILSLDFNCT